MSGEQGRHTPEVDFSEYHRTRIELNTERMAAVRACAGKGAEERGRPTGASHVSHASAARKLTAA